MNEINSKEIKLNLKNPNDHKAKIQVKNNTNKI